MTVLTVVSFSVDLSKSRHTMTRRAKFRVILAAKFPMVISRMNCEICESLAVTRQLAPTRFQNLRQADYCTQTRRTRDNGVFLQIELGNKKIAVSLFLYGQFFRVFFLRSKIHITFLSFAACIERF